jgi:hypothetical protein
MSRAEKSKIHRDKWNKRKYGKIILNEPWIAQKRGKHRNTEHNWNEMAKGKSGECRTVGYLS